jgi:hypothetical protein
MGFSAKRDRDRHIRRKHTDKENKDTKELCKLCFKAFKTNQELVQHIRTDHQSTKLLFACRDCMATCSSEAELKNHKHKCKNCQLEFDSKATFVEHKECVRECELYYQKLDAKLTDPKPDTSAQSGQCTVCYRKFVSTKQLNIHKLIHVNGEKPVIPCPLCNRIFSSQEELETHKVKHEKEKVREVFPRDGEIFLCEECGERFLSQCMLQGHEYRCDGKQQKKAPRFACLICSKEFISNSGLDLHVRKRVCTKGPFKCQLGCDRIFETLKGIYSHQRTCSRKYVQKDEKKLELDVPVSEICGGQITKIFDDKIQVSEKAVSGSSESDKHDDMEQVCRQKCNGVHDASTETNEKVNKKHDTETVCSKTGKRTNGRYGPGQYRKKKHLEKNKDTNTFCKLCSKDFKTNQELVQHVRTGHQSTKLLFACRDCKAMCSEADIKNHRHKCKNCQLEFDSKATFVEHKECVRECGLYYQKLDAKLTAQCTVCYRKFVSTKQLNIHKLMHSKSEKPVIPYPLCDRILSSQHAQEELETHKLTHEKEKVSETNEKNGPGPGTKKEHLEKSPENRNEDEKTKMRQYLFTPLRVPDSARSQNGDYKVDALFECAKCQTSHKKCVSIGGVEGSKSLVNKCPKCLQPCTVTFFIPAKWDLKVKAFQGSKEAFLISS